MGAGLGILLCSESLLFVAGDYILREVILKDYEVRNKTVRFLFALMFATACGLSEGVILDVVEILNDGDRRVFRELNTYTSLLLVALVIPFYAIYLQLSHVGHAHTKNNKWIVILALWMTYLLLFWVAFAKFNQNLSAYNKISVSAVAGRVSMAGVIIMALMSGFSAVNVPYRTLPFFNRVTDKEIRDLKSNYVELVEVLLELKVEVLFTELHMLSPSNQEKSRESRTHKRGFFGRILGDTSQTTGVSQEERLEFKKFEICSVEESLKCFYIRLREKMSQRETVENFKSYVGMMHLWSIYLLTIYLGWKVITTIVNLIIGRSQAGDAFSSTLGMINQNLNVDMDLTLWSLRLSFIMVAVIILSNLRNLVLEFSKIFSFFNSSHSFETTAIIFAGMMGSYVLSTLVMIQPSLHPKYRSIIFQTFGHLELKFYQRLFDITFILTAGLTALLLYLRKAKTESEEILLI